MRQNCRSPGPIGIWGRIWPFKRQHALNLLLRGCPTTARGNTYALFDSLASFITQISNIHIAQNQHTFPHTSKLGVVPLDAFDDDCGGHAIQILSRTFSVWVRVIPVESRWSIRRHMHFIIEFLSRH